MPAEYLEDSYQLCPIQQGMLFNSLYDPDSGVDIIQLICTLREDLAVAAFVQAWQSGAARHAILRTAFRWAGLAEPVQEVYRQAELPYTLLDGCGLSAPERQAWLESYLVADRLRGFTLTDAPLMRMALLRFGDADYRFVLTFHHILLDGRSLLLLLKEIFSVYEAYRLGQDLVVAPPRPYRDYIAWRERQDFSGDEIFWRQLLAGFTAPTPLAIGSDGAYTPAAGHATEQVALPGVLAAALQDTARQHQMTLNTLIQAAWALLLSRYSGRTDVVFGAIRSCRRSTVEGADAMVGLFLNTLPVRAQVPPAMPLLAVLKELRAQGVAVRQYQHTSLMEVQRWSEVPKGMPLFESIVVFENFLMDTTLRSQGGSWQNRAFELRRQPNYALSLYVFAEPDLLATIIYDRQRFDQATITRMLGHFQALLAGMVAGLERPIADLPLLTEAESRQLLIEWNATHADRPNVCVHHRFEAQVERDPGALAVVAGADQITYGQLNQQANQLAHYLRRLGVRPEVPAGICMERSLALIVAQLAVLKAGGAYVSLDPAAPPERLARMLEDSQAKVLITRQEPRTKNQEPESPAEGSRFSVLGSVVDLDADWEAIALQPDTNPDSGISMDNLAYVIYTSGSTGRPKGVQIPHAGLSNLVAWHQRTYAIDPRDRATLVASPAFDASVWEIWPYLTAGASLHLPDEDTRGTPARLVEWLIDRAITIGFLPTALAEAALGRPWPAGAALRALLVGGDQLHQAPRAGLPFELYNHYGPTENSVVATVGHIAAGGEAARLPPIGRPIANVQVYLLDAQLRPVPIGIPGELYIGGAGLARGYLGRPDLTAERFIPNPFATTDPPDKVTRRQGDKVTEIGESITLPPLHPVTVSEESAVGGQWSVVSGRMYRTGDLARYLPDGTIEFLGRIDAQVKIRGFRIELGEIEAVLSQHPAVREAVVLAREDTPRDKRLIAYITQEPRTKNQEPTNEEPRTKNQEPTTEDSGSRFSVLGSGEGSRFSVLGSGVGELRAFLKQRLPDYMVPSAFVLMDAFPLTSSGKIDRRALAARHPEWVAHETHYIAPRTPIEEMLAGIWAEVLDIRPGNGRPPVGTRDNFFELGGHSLLATQLIFRVYQVFHVELPLRSLFEAATIIEFAEVIERAKASGAAPVSPEIAPLDRNRHRVRVS